MTRCATCSFHVDDPDGHCEFCHGPRPAPVGVTPGMEVVWVRAEVERYEEPRRVPPAVATAPLPVGPAYPQPFPRPMHDPAPKRPERVGKAPKFGRLRSLHARLRVLPDPPDGR